LLALPRGSGTVYLTWTQPCAYFWDTYRDHSGHSACVTVVDPDADLYADSSDADTVIAYITAHT
jgi:hypothetical protein